ncbi:hypothetical protein MCSV2_10315 [Mucispirillum schaedleri ASF457]|nr:hypothetical protein MCSV2_10315 [Mucispirillum schaedleri ASF457]
MNNAVIIIRIAGAFITIIFLDIDALFILNIFKSSNDIKTCTFFNMKKDASLKPKLK